MEETQDNDHPTSPTHSSGGSTRQRRTKIESLDGAYRYYTTAVLTTMTLGIVVLAFERGFLTGRNNEKDKERFWGFAEDIDIAGKRILRSLILLLFAAIVGAVAYLTLIPNLRGLHQRSIKQAKRWVFYSMVGLLSVNVLAGINVSSAEKAFQLDSDNGSFDSAIAHYILIVSFLVSVFAMNVMYLWVILLPFVETQNDPHQSGAKMGWSRLRFIVRERPEDLRRLAETTEQGGETKGKKKQNFCFRWIHDGFAVVMDVCADATLKGTQAFVTFCQTSLPNAFKRLDCMGSTYRGTLDRNRRFSESVLRIGDRIRKSSVFVFVSKAWRETTGFISKMWLGGWRSISKWAKDGGDTPDGVWYKRMSLGLVQFSEGSVNQIKMIKPMVQDFGQRIWDNVKEEGEFYQSSWVKAAVITSIILLIYFGLNLVVLFQGFYGEIYKPSRDCLLSNPELTDFFIRSYSFDLDHTEKGSETLPDDFTFDSSLIEIVQDPDELVVLENCGDRRIPKSILETAKAFEAQAEAAAESDDPTPSDTFTSSTLGEIAYILDIMLRNLAWTSWIGFAVGLVIGIYSLLSIFEQYKRVSYAIRSGVFKNLPKDLKSMATADVPDETDLQEYEKWDRVLSAYPLSLSVFFFGILVSTAVVQLVVFGTLVAGILAMIVSLFNDMVYEIMKPFLAFGIAFLVTWLLNGFVATAVVGEAWLLDRHTLVHEMLFILFLLVYTAVHLVLGVFLAIVRIVFLLISTFSKISRLDKNLFITWRARDLGHKSFVAMVFLHHAFQNVKQQDSQSAELWMNVLAQLRQRRTNPGSPRDGSHFQSVDLNGDSPARTPNPAVNVPIPLEDSSEATGSRVHNKKPSVVFKEHASGDSLPEAAAESSAATGSSVNRARFPEIFHPGAQSVTVSIDGEGDAMPEEGRNQVSVDTLQLEAANDPEQHAVNVEEVAIEEKQQGLQQNSQPRDSS